MRNSKIQFIGAAAALTAVMALPAGAFAQDEDAMVRVLHGADAPNVDIYVDGGLAIPDLAFGTDSGYIALPGGEYLIQVVPAGATLEEGPIVIDATLPFESGTKTTVAATGSLEAGDFQPQVIVDEVVMADDSANVRVVHLVTDAPAVDVAPDGADALLEGLEYPNNTGYVALPGGAYDLEVRVAGTEDVAIQIPEMTLEDGTSYSVFAIGTLGGETITVLPTVDSAAEMMDEAE
jgi:hypothetical protein